MDPNAPEETRHGPVQEKKRGSTLLSVCPYILGCELCERLAYYGLSTNLVVYLQKLGLTSIQAAIWVSVFSGSCYLTPLFGGYLSDAKWGRYRTILYSSMTYLVGIVILTLSAYLPALHPSPGEVLNGYQGGVLFLSLALIAVGTGGIKPNVSAFGADQFDETIASDKKDKDSFFNWFYLSVNIGSLVASIFIVYIQVHVSWGLGFLIPGIAMTMAVSLFVLGKPKYKHQPPGESPVTRVFNVTMAALNHRGKRSAYDKQEEGTSDASAPLLSDGSASTASQGSDEQHWLDNAVGHGFFTPEQVYEVKLVYGVIPVFLTTILYWTVYAQMSTFFIQQGSLMNRSICGIVIPAASLSVFDTLSIIVLIPVYDRAVVPLLQKLWRRPTTLEKIGWGYLTAVLAMVVSAIVEQQRLKKFHANDVVIGQKTDVAGDVVNMSIWWQSFQYVAIGLSEIWASIGQLEFFYDQAPDVMRSCMLALQLFGTAMGGYFATFLMGFIHYITKAIPGGEWIPDDLNMGRLDLMYLTIGGVMLLDTIAFVIVAKRYKCKEVEHTPKHPPSSAIDFKRPVEAEEEEEEFDIYARSVAYRAGTPTLPPELR